MFAFPAECAPRFRAASKGSCSWYLHADLRDADTPNRSRHNDPTQASDRAFLVRTGPLARANLRCATDSKPPQCSPASRCTRLASRRHRSQCHCALLRAGPHPRQVRVSSSLLQERDRARRAVHSPTPPSRRMPDRRMPTSGSMIDAADARRCGGSVAGMRRRVRRTHRSSCGWIGSSAEFALQTNTTLSRSAVRTRSHTASAKTRALPWPHRTNKNACKSAICRRFRYWRSERDSNPR